MKLRAHLIIFIILSSLTPIFAQEIDPGPNDPRPIDASNQIDLQPIPPDALESLLQQYSQTASSPADQLVYSSTLGNIMAPLPVNSLVADDIVTLATEGCSLARYEFTVSGKVLPTGVGGPFTVNYALYRDCPGSLPAAQRPTLIIPGTQGSTTFGDDGLHLVSFGVPDDVTVAVPTAVWLGISMSRSNAGVIMGGMPLVGFSADIWDFPQAGACNSFLGGFPDRPHATINAQIFVREGCPPVHPGYRNNNSKQLPLNPGAGVTILDDIELGVDQCNMVAYEVHVKGIGFYQFDLRNECDNGSIIPGTHRALPVLPPSNTIPIRLRFKVDPPIPIPKNFWMATNVGAPSGGIIVLGSSPTIGMDPLATGDCLKVDGLNVDLTIFCAGPPPTGACCDMIQRDERGEAICREVPHMNCAWPPRGLSIQPQWMEGEVCAPDPFNRRCGLSACCKPDDTCENLTKDQCNAVEPIDAPRLWQRGLFCNENGQACPFSACLTRGLPCLSAHEGVGCADSNCCQSVCEQDSWCCYVEWDRTCVELASAVERCSYITAYDTCFYGARTGSLLVESNSHVTLSNAHNYNDVNDPPNCCNNLNADSAGYGTTWFSFIATQNSATIGTCNTDSERDTLIGIYAAANHSSPQDECESLIPIACADDTNECSESGKHGKVCVTGLTPGETYYIVVGSKTYEDLGLFQLDVQSPCNNAPEWNTDDCNENSKPDGCDIASMNPGDCNENNNPDDCEASRVCVNGSNIFVPEDCRDDTFIESKVGHFGASLALDGNTLAVGRPYTYGRDGIEAVYIYRRSGLNWTLDVRIPSPLGGVSDGFGSVLALRGEWLFVTAKSGATQGLGAVFAYRLPQAGFWQFVHEFSAFYGSDDQFGAALAASIQYLVIGDPRIGGPPRCHIYQLEGDRWGYLYTIEHPSPNEDSRFGYSIDIDESSIAIGAPGESENSGAVHLFERIQEYWRPVRQITSPEPHPGMRFGSAVAVQGDQILIGAPGFNHQNTPGAAYIFDRLGDEWTVSARLTPPEDTNMDWFGTSVALHGATALIAPNTGPNNPTLCSLFRNVNSSWIFAANINDPNGPNGYEGWQPQIELDSLTGVVGYSNTWDYPDLGTVVSFFVASTDCNQNNQTDSCDIHDGQSLDCNANEIPDDCEPGATGDYDHDGLVHRRDYIHFPNCMNDTIADFPCCKAFDAAPADAAINLRDFAAFQNSFTP